MSEVRVYIILRPGELSALLLIQLSPTLFKSFPSQCEASVKLSSTVAYRNIVWYLWKLPNGKPDSGFTGRLATDLINDCTAQ
jgi:hypothetical protein